MLVPAAGKEFQYNTSQWQFRHRGSSVQFFNGNLPQLSVPQPALAGSGEWLTALKAAGRAGLAAGNPPILH